MKIIKLTEDHYIVVDDSEIKEGDYCTTHLNIIDVGKIHNSYTIFNPQNKEHLDLLKSCKKITHSTQPLGFLNEVGLTTANLKPDWTNVEYLPLSEVKELLGEVDVEKKAHNWFMTEKFMSSHIADMKSFIAGYNQALEDNKEKQFTREDMMKMWKFGYNERNLDDSIESFQPKTEWNVEIVEGKLKLKS